MRKIAVLTTNGGAKNIESEATTLKELQNELTKAGVSWSGMKMADNKKRSYEHPDAELPDDLTNIFLFPIKTKSGGELSFSECRAFIKQALEDNEEAAKAHFNVGKNYTTKSTADLRELVASYKPKGGSKAKSTPAPAATKEKAVTKATPVKEEKKAPARVAATVKGTSAVPAKNVSDVVKDVATSKSEPAGQVTPDGIVSMLESLKTEGKYNNSTIDDAIKAVIKIKVVGKDELDKSALEKEAREMAKGFSDVKNF